MSNDDGSWHFFSTSSDSLNANWSRRDSIASWIIVLAFAVGVWIVYAVNLLPDPAFMYAFFLTVAAISLRLLILAWEMFWGNAEWTKRLSIWSWVITAVVLAGIIVLFFTNMFPPGLAGFYGFTASMIAVGFRVAFYILEKLEANPSVPMQVHLQWAVILAVAFFSMFLILTLVFDIGFFALFSSDWSVQIFWFVGMEYALLAVIGVYNIYKTLVEKDWFNAVFILAFITIPLVILIMIFTGIKMDRSVPFWIGVAISGVLGFIIFYRLPKESRNKTLGIILTFLGALWVVLFLLIDPYQLITTTPASISGPSIFIGAVNPFSTIWYLFFQAGTAPTMIAIMTFGAVVYVFSKTFGDMIKAGQAVGAILMIVPPMIIIMMMFSGSITAPSTLVDLLGAGVASFIYATAETGVFVIVMVLLLAFTGMVKAVIG
jgi:hypothetical protein